MPESVQIQACAMRATRLALDGSPVPGADSAVTVSSLVEFTFTPEYEEGEEILLKNACGDICVNYKETDKLKRVTFDFNICNVDPFVMELMAGGTLIEVSGEHGYAAPAIGEDPTPNGVSLELWAKRIDSSGGLISGAAYARWLFPRIYVRHGAKTFGTAPQVTQFTGFGIENDEWLDGPEDDWPYPGAPSHLAWQWIPVNTLPTITSGYVSASAS